MALDYFLSKLLSLFVYPLGMAIFLGVVAAVLVWKGKQRSGFAATVSGVILLWICAMPVFLRTVDSVIDRVLLVT